MLLGGDRSWKKSETATYCNIRHKSRRVGQPVPTSTAQESLFRVGEQSRFATLIVGGNEVWDDTIIVLLVVNWGKHEPANAQRNAIGYSTEAGETYEIANLDLQTHALDNSKTPRNVWHPVVLNMSQRWRQEATHAKAHRKPRKPS